MSNVATLRPPSSDEFAIDLNELVPDSTWELSYLGHETRLMFGSAGKLVLRFKIIDPGEHFEKEVCRYYNVELIGKPGNKGRFKPGRNSNFVRDYVTLFGRPRRGDRISLRQLCGHIVIGRTRTVKTNSKGKSLGEAAYSVVDELIGFKD
ncbi:hypothetical protein SB783_19440 [Paraburkholderia sp. SIMBA_009]